jgi:heme a synthase
MATNVPSKGRLHRWRTAAVESDRLGPADGDTPGPIVQRIRDQAGADSSAFKKSMLTVIGVLVVSQIGVVLLKNTSKTTRSVVSGPLSLAAGVAGVAIALLFLGRYVRIVPRRYRVIAGVSATLLCFIMLTGAAVRLTGSGLGCPDWPTCKQGKVVPASGTHAQIEFGNRIVTGLCVFAAAIGVLTALVRVPYRRDLVRLGLLTSFLIFSNAILGGLTVIYGLKPQFVMSHFLLSIVTIASGVLVFHRSGESGGSRDLWGRDRVASIDPLSVRLVQGLTLASLAVMFLGTVTTGTGPHGGDPKVARFNYPMRDVVRIHSGAVWIMLALTVLLALRAATTPGDAAAELRKRMTVLIAVSLAQGAVGYIQYFTRLPVGLVEVHVLGATLVWVSVLWVRAATWLPYAERVMGPSPSAARVRGALSQNG